VNVDEAEEGMERKEKEARGMMEERGVDKGGRNYKSNEMKGSEGSLVFNLERLNELQYYSRADAGDRQGFRTIMVTEGSHPYMEAWWPSGHIIGWEHTFTHQVVHLMRAISQKQSSPPTFEDGLRCQQVLEAVERSSETRQWVRPSDIH